MGRGTGTPCPAGNRALLLRDSDAVTGDEHPPESEHDMDHLQHFYIDGAWVDPIGTNTIDVVNPATEDVIATIAGGGPEDVDAAVAAAKAAFPSFSATSREERLELLDRIIDVYKTRIPELAAAVTSEMGAPAALAAAAPVGLVTLRPRA